MKWINVKDRLPQARKWVFITNGKLIAIERIIDNGNGEEWDDCSYDDKRELEKQNADEIRNSNLAYFLKFDQCKYLYHDEITHWMYLPEPPKDNE